MKKHILIFLLVFFISTIQSLGQTYYLNNGFNNGGTVTTCSGTFYDSNPVGTYSKNENYTVTFCSGNSSKIIQVSFSTLNITTGDTLFTYDGNTTASPVIDTFTNNFQNLITYTASTANTSGCLTFKFISDGIDQSDGWKADIKCLFPCKQSIVATVTSSPVKDNGGYTNICFGDAAGFTVKTQYPDNNSIYHQADATSLFHWYFGDGKDTIAQNLLSITHRYTAPGGFYAKLVITDTNGCVNTTPVQFPVRTSLQPNFNITTPASICLFDTAQIQPTSVSNGQASVTTATGSFVNSPVSGDSVFIPDNPPLCKTTGITLDQFAPGQTLNQISDLLGITINMEHSYLGDLTISIQAPNGTKVFLKSTVQGSPNDGTFLGEPVDESLWGAPSNPALINIPGKGYNYTFNSNPKYGTMWSEVSKYIYSYIDNAGQVVTNHYYLPAGSYASEESLLPLVGTPLNGTWTLEICDKQAVDNGYLFNWKIDFKPALYPVAQTYTVPIVSQTWLPASGLIKTNNTTAVISPSSPGNFKYTYRVKDAFGCLNDSTVTLVVNPLPAKPNLGKDTTICSGQNIYLNVLNPNTANKYKWSTNQSDTFSINISKPGSYWVQATDSNNCRNRDTIQVVQTSPFTLHLGNDTLYCASKPNILTATASSVITTWKWSTGVTTPADTISSAGNYWVEAKSASGCIIRDSISVANNPVNVFDLPNDTTICESSSYTLTISPPAGTTITWNDGSTDYARLINKAATYSLVANNAGCLHNTDITIGIRPLPVFSLGKDTTLCTGFNLTLSATYPGATYQWSTGSTDSVIVTAISGLYWAEAKLNGCTFRDSLTMTQKTCECDIKMPNAFSPNGDGINDFYRPGIQCFPKNYHLSIFNRYGQIIFDTKDYNTTWDGRYKGSPLPVATYYYILTFDNVNLMQTEKHTGSITLLR